MANLGFVSLGLMGSRTVKRLLGTGHQVTGYNRTRARANALIGAGMQWRDTPREVAEAADITFSVVSDTVALLFVAYELGADLSDQVICEATKSLFGKR